MKGNTVNIVSKKLSGFFLALIIALGTVAVPVFSNDSLALETTGNATFDKFINDSRWTNGASWGYKGPEISSWSSVQCCAYVADFVKYCYNEDRPFRDQYEYHNANNISAGDVIRMGSEAIYPYRTHYIVVLKRSGNSLYTAEGNWGERVRIGWNYTILDANRIDGISYKFADGAAYHYGSPVNNGGGTSLPTKKYEPASDFYAFIVRPDVWKAIDSNSSNNVQITTSSNSDAESACMWRFEKQDTGAYAIFNQKNGYCLDASGGGTSNGTNVITYKEYVGGKNQQWLLYDSGAGTVIKSANCDLVLDCSGGYSSPGTNIQIWEYNGTQAQRFNVYVVAKRYDLPSEQAYAYLIRHTPWLHLENSANANVQIAASGNDSMDPKQVWQFTHQPDGSYMIDSAYRSGYVSIYMAADASLSNGANVLTADYSSIKPANNTHWYVYKLQEEYGANLIFRVKNREQVLNCTGSSRSSNVTVTSFNLAQGQKFSVWFLSQDNRVYSRPGNPNAPTVTAPSSALAGADINISWTSSPLKNADFDTRAYRVEILDADGKIVNSVTTTSLSVTRKIETAGTYSIRVRAINTEYPGDSISSVSAVKTVAVSNPVKALTSSMISSVPDQVYIGSALTPAVTVKDGTATLKSGTDYTVAYSDNVNAGEGVITVTGKGSYTGTVTVKFKIVKATYTVTLSRVVNGNATLSKTTACEGDEIVVSYSPNTGFFFDCIKVNGSAISGNKFKMPAKNTTVEVLFKDPTFKLSTNVTGEGTVTLSKNFASAGEEITVTAVPAEGYRLESIEVNGSAIEGNKFTMPFKNCTVDVTFKKTDAHNLTKVPAKSATCTAAGNTAYYVCEDPDCGCKKFYSDKEGTVEISAEDTVVPATGHKLEKVSTVAATCTSEGKAAHWKCSKCNKLFLDSEGKTEVTSENLVIDALGHDKEHLEHHKAVKETHLKDGNIEFYVCPGCGKLFADSDCKNEIQLKDTIIPRKGAAELGEVATVDGLKYMVTLPFTDGSGTVSLCGVETSAEYVSVPETVEIKDAVYTVNRISSKAFYGDKTVKSVYIGSTVVNIDASAFCGCSNLIRVSGGENLKTIGANAFSHCTKLKTFVISSKVLSKIGPTCFYKDSKLKTIYIRNTTKLTKAGVKKSLKGSSVKKIKVKKSKVSAYKKYFKKSVSGKSVKVR